MLSLALVAAAVFAYALVSRRLERSPISAPMLFVAFGVLLGPLGVGLIDQPLDVGGIGLLAEATLVLLLYTDAIRIDVRFLRRDHQLPLRMLAIGIPLSVGLGFLAARWILPELGWVGALAVAVILAPTDAALAQPVLTDNRIAMRIRQAINVESGLNDGLMLPVVTVVATIAAMQAGPPSEWIQLAVRQVGLGVVMGATIGAAGGWLLDRFASRDWVGGALRQLATLSIGVAAFAVAESIGANGFVAAFVAGLAFGGVARDQCDGAYDFAEDEGVLLSLLTFLAFGATLASDALASFDLRYLLYGVVSLVVVRMPAVAVSLLGAGLRLPTIGFLGWFGPRGLASILFGVFLLEETSIGATDGTFLVITWTVLASIVAHGVSAGPLAQVYGDWFEGRSDGAMAEQKPVTEHPLRAWRPS